MSLETDKLMFRAWVERMLAELKMRGKTFEIIEYKNPANPYRISVSGGQVYTEPLFDSIPPNPFSSKEILKDNIEEVEGEYIGERGRKQLVMSGDT